jgi:hypothetical protein
MPDAEDAITAATRDLSPIATIAALVMAIRLIIDEQPEPDRARLIARCVERLQS